MVIQVLRWHTVAMIGSVASSAPMWSPQVLPALNRFSLGTFRLFWLMQRMHVRLSSDLARDMNSYLSVCVSPAYRHMTFPGYAQPLAGGGILDKQKKLMGGGFLRVFIFFSFHVLISWFGIDYRKLLGPAKPPCTIAISCFYAFRLICCWKAV